MGGSAERLQRHGRLKSCKSEVGQFFAGLAVELRIAPERQECLFAEVREDFLRSRQTCVPSQIACITHDQTMRGHGHGWRAFHLETAAKLPDITRSHFQLFSKCTLKSLNNRADFDSAVWLPSLRRGPLLKRPTSKSTPSSACKEVQQNVQQGVQHENEAADLSVCCSNEKSNKDFRAERFTRSNHS